MYQKGGRFFHFQKPHTSELKKLFISTFKENPALLFYIRESIYENSAQILFEYDANKIQGSFHPHVLAESTKSAYFRRHETELKESSELLTK